MNRAAWSVGVIAGSLVTAASANAYVNTMFESLADPSTYGSLIASLDIADTSWDFPPDTSFGYTNSGYKAETLVADVPVLTNDTTTLVSEVYSVTTQTTFVNGPDSLTLNPGDRVFSYRIRLTSPNSNTIDTMREFGVTGLAESFGGEGFFDDSIVLGRGLSVAGLGSGTANFPEPVAGDFDFLGGVFGSLDWQWPVNAIDQMNAGEEITLLMFTRNVPVVEGLAKFVGVPGQSSLITDPNANNAPVLIPAIPGPGAAVGLLAGGLLVGARRRR